MMMFYYLHSFTFTSLSAAKWRVQEWHKQQVLSLHCYKSKLVKLLALLQTEIISRLLGWAGLGWAGLGTSVLDSNHRTNRVKTGRV